MKQFGMYEGEFLCAICLHSPLNEVKAESATITGDLPYFKAVAAPILLPHNSTLNPA